MGISVPLKSSCTSAATPRPSRIAARSRGPPRCTVKRLSARIISGHRRRWPINSLRRRSSSRKNCTASRRSSIAEGSVSGAASRADNMRAPGPVTVQSMAANKLPWRPPERLRISSRFARVAASISITEPAARRLGGAIRGIASTWVRAT